MITRWMLDDVQAEFSKVEGLIEALHIVIDVVDTVETGYRRKQLDALIGVKCAIEQQMKVAQEGFNPLFAALREGAGGQA